MRLARRDDERSCCVPVTPAGGCAFGPPPETATLDDAIHLWRYETGAADARDVRRCAHAARDRLLEAYAGGTVRIGAGECGKPFALEPDWLDFNLSHAGSTVVLAFARGQALGVDIERRHRRNAVDDIARRFFAAAEAQALAELAPPRRRDAFIGLWTCKEALLKARGDGLSFGLDRIEFALGVDGEVASLLRLGGDALDGWRITRFEVGPDVTGCLAWNGAARDVRLYRFVP